MHTWHRWLSVIFGIFMLRIAVTGTGSFAGVFHPLHSGESLGPLGTAISVLSGLALVFFSASGIWLYMQMWRNRAARIVTPRWFWK
ncbi:hypothetical protein [Novosphingobium colocasiae]|uniref:Uncharacterized protein n=1 Tax=Novosphingobium colocasiae TaxID=1256513 RepID=A0A918UD97_9SPHN|nr:hypothetical protein [Novosphingobium colocasiae]GGY91419.1 hypothetical protein GCM10011614_02620 [Novosphingobium colocasiae]